MKPLWSEAKKDNAIKYVEDISLQLNIGGRVRVSREGINATISGDIDDVREFNKRLIDFDDQFRETDFKYINDMPIDRAFKDMKVLPVKELVFYGIDATLDLGPGGCFTNVY